MMPIDDSLISRRGFVASAAALAAMYACGSPESPFRKPFGNYTIKSRPRTPTIAPVPGITRLWDDGPTAFLFVPNSYDPAKPPPLMVAMHGAGGTAAGPLDLLSGLAQANGFILISPESGAGTWDGIYGVYSPDVATIDRALGLTFDRCVVDASRITLEGFSDGASYSLGLGLLNADLFKKIVAFSPGFITATEVGKQKPAIFISHGHQDPVLPFEGTRDNIIPTLQKVGCSVQFKEFDGVHMVPPDVAAAGVAFMMGA